MTDRVPKKLSFGIANVEKMGLTRQVVQDVVIYFFFISCFLAYDPETWLDQLLRDDRFKVIVVCSQVS